MNDPVDEVLETRRIYNKGRRPQLKFNKRESKTLLNKTENSKLAQYLQLCTATGQVANVKQFLIEENIAISSEDIIIRMTSSSFKDYDEECERSVYRYISHRILDLKNPATRSEIIAELGCRRNSLVRMISDVMFREEYASTYKDVEAVSDPNIDAAKHIIVEELVPQAIRVLSDLITNRSTPPGIRLKAAERILSAVGVEKIVKPESDKAQVAQYLTQINVAALPDEYQGAVERFLKPHAPLLEAAIPVDGNYNVVEDLDIE